VIPILAFDSDEENILLIEKNQKLDVYNIIPASYSSSDSEEINAPTRKRKRLMKK